MVERATGIRVGVSGGDQVRRELKSLGDEGQRALARIETAGRPASRGLLAVNAAAREGRAALQGYAASAGPLGGTLAALGPAGLAAAAGIGGLVLGLRAAIQRSGEAVQSFDEIGKTADKIGFTTSALQELRFAAELSGVEVGTLDLALQRFSRRSGEAARGQGELVKTAKEYGVELRDNAGRMRANEAILADFAEVIRGAESDQERLRIAFKLFDSEGAALVNLLGQGSDAMARLRQEAHDLGIVIDESVIRQAERTQDKLTTLQRVIDANLNQAFVDLAGVTVFASEGMATFARLAREASDSVRLFFDGLESGSAQALRDRMAEVNAEIERTQAILAEAEKARRDGGIIGFLNRLPLGITNVEDLRERLADLNREAAAINALLSERSRPSAVAPAAPTLALEAGAAGAGKEAEAAQKVIEALQFELEQLGRTEFGKRAMNLLRQAGAAATEEERQAILDLALALQNETDRQKEATDAAKLAAQAKQQLERAAQSLIAGTRTETEQLEAQIATLETAIDQGLVPNIEEAIEALKRMKGELDNVEEDTNEVADAIKSGLNRAIDSYIDALVRGEIEWDNWANIATSAVASVAASLIQLQTNALIDFAFAGFGGAGGHTLAGGAGAGLIGPEHRFLAKGGVLEDGRLTRFAGGGVIDRPTLFPMANGMGLAGEAGPEVIAPLRRMADGDMGIRAIAPPIVVPPAEVNITIENNSGVPLQVQQRRGPTGEIILALARALAADLDAGGPMHGAIRRNFKVAPVTG